MRIYEALFCVAFTSYKEVHWIAPIISSAPFGSGIYYVFTSVFTYLVTAYRPIAASAMASNSAMRSSFAAAFPLFAGPMYKRLGAPGAMALLAGLATLMIPLPYAPHFSPPFVMTKLRALGSCSPKLALDCELNLGLRQSDGLSHVGMMIVISRVLGAPLLHGCTS